MNYASTVLADSPIRYYRLGESSGTTAVDIGSQAQNGTLNGGITLAQTGLLVGDSNTSELFDGSTGYISVPTTGLPSGAQALSLECWTYMATLPNSSNFPFLVDVGTNATAEEFSIYMNGNAIQAGFKSAGNVTSGTVSAATVYHVVATFDGTNIRLYLNGSLVGGPTAVTSPNLVLGACSIGMQVGGAGGASVSFPGVLDEVAIYSTALSAAQVAAHYTAGTTAPVIARPKNVLRALTGMLLNRAFEMRAFGATLIKRYQPAINTTAYASFILTNNRPIAYYRVNEASGSVAYDASGNSYHAHLTGVTAQSQPGAVGDGDFSTLFTAAGGIMLPPSLHLEVWPTFGMEFWIFVEGVWEYVGVDWDGTTTTVYRNGAPYTPGPGASVGIEQGFAWAGAAMAGKLDEIALYPRLTSAMAAADYAAGNTTARFIPHALMATLVQSFNLKDIATRFILVSGAPQTIRDITARFRQRSADQQKDVGTRLRMRSADKLSDIVARFRQMSANQLKDISARFRQKSADQQKDVTARLRVRSADQGRDVASRLRLMSANQLRDVVARLRLRSADQVKDIAARLRLAKFVDIATRLRLTGSIVKDVSTRLRLRSADQLKDIVGRVRLRSADQLKDIASRFRQRSADQLKDVVSRLRLRSANQLKDVTSRLRLAKFMDMATRLRLRSADQLKDIIARFRLRSADQLRDITSRLRLRSADQLKDVRTRLRLRSADQQKDIASRLVLAAAQQRLKDIASRLLLRSANQLKDIQARLKLAKFVDIAARLRLRSANQLRDITARLRLKSVDKLLDIASRLRLRSADQARDVVSRFRQRSTNQLKDIVARVRLMSAFRLLDITSRLRLRSADQLRDVSTRVRMMSITQRKDVATRVRVISAAQLRDIAGRLRQISQPQPRDIRGRFILVIFIVSQHDIACRLILTEYHVSHITVTSPRGHVDAHAPRSKLTAVSARGILTVEEE